jgi:hypothetical protein
MDTSGSAASTASGARAAARIVDSRRILSVYQMVVVQVALSLMQGGIRFVQIAHERSVGSGCAARELNPAAF